MGGSLENQVTVQKRPGYAKTFEDPDRAFGRESRSLKACFEMLEANVPAKNIMHMKVPSGDMHMFLVAKTRLHG